MIPNGTRVLLPGVVSDGHDSQNVVVTVGAVDPNEPAIDRQVVVHQRHSIEAHDIELMDVEEATRLRLAERNLGGQVETLKKQLADIEAGMAKAKG